MIFQARLPSRLPLTLALALLTISTTARAQPQAGAALSAGRAGDVEILRAELAEARAMLAEQNRQLAEQKRRLDMMDQRMAGLAQSAASRGSDGDVAAAASQPLGSQTLQVGQPPADTDRAPTVAVLDQQGSVVTRRGQLITELGFDYTRSDRNRAIFRGVELIETVLVGVFDINESRQDILSASASARFGVTDRLEVGARVPYLYRSDKLVTTPVAGSSNNAPAQTVDNSVNGAGLGDIEITARYQLNNGGHNSPFLIANLQAVIPTGRDPFSVTRDGNGVATQAATGAGFFGISPSLTAILPSEPAVLFGTIGYTFNLAENVNTKIPPVQIDRINPGNQINISAGVGLALNERTSLNFGYTHAWSFGTTTWTRQIDERTGQPVGNTVMTRSRDLQVGRFLFGVSQRFSDAIQLNWAVEVGATEDAPDVRTTMRLPFAF